MEELKLEEAAEEPTVDEPETYTGSIRVVLPITKEDVGAYIGAKGTNLRKFVIAKTYKDMEDDDGKNDGKVTCTVKSSEEGETGYQCHCTATAPDEDRANKYLESMSENVITHSQVFRSRKRRRMDSTRSLSSRLEWIIT